MTRFWRWRATRPTAPTSPSARRRRPWLAAIWPLASNACDRCLRITLARLLPGRRLDLLNRQGVSYDGLQRGRAAFSAGDYQAAIDAFNEYTTTHQLAAIPAELFLTLGRAYRQIGNSEAAAVAFQTIIDQYPQDPLFGDALLERGRTRFLAGDSPAAIQIYLSIADTYPLFEHTAGVALWRAAYLYGTNGQTAQSREVFTRLADSYPNHEFTINGLFNAASAAVTGRGVGDRRESLRAHRQSGRRR